jgi:hypothetical protein
LREQELRIAREIRAAALASKTKAPVTTPSFRGKKYKLKRIIKGDGKGIDSWRYIKYVDRPILWPTCKKLLEEDPEFVLMEDNAPGHDCWYTKSEREKAGITAKVDWPPNSPDFNPIEQIWMLMKSRIQTRRGAERVTTLSRMKKDLQEEWDRITIEEINKEISRLPTVMARCIAVNGGNNFHG